MSASKKTLPYLALVIAILSMGTSAILVRWADAPGPVTAFYRVFLATVILTPFFIQRCLKKCNLSRSVLVMPILGGLFTAFDLALWNTSLFYTTAGNATLLVNTNPLWVALGAWLIFREKLSKDFWIGLTIALLGAALVVGGDFLVHTRLGVGDLIAISAGFFYAGYFLVTQRGRADFHPITYIWIIGLSASIGLALINLALGNSFTGYTSQTWRFLDNCSRLTSDRLHGCILCPRASSRIRCCPNNDRTTDHDHSFCHSTFRGNSPSHANHWRHHRTDRHLSRKSRLSKEYN